MPIGTMGIGVDDQDDVIQYAPPGTSVIDQGSTITNGQYQGLAAGEQMAFEGVIQFAGGSGLMTVVEDATVTFRTVTIILPS